MVGTAAVFQVEGDERRLMWKDFKFPVLTQILLKRVEFWFVLSGEVMMAASAFILMEGRSSGLPGAERSVILRLLTSWRSRNS